MDISYEEARAECVRYYVEIGNSEEHADIIVKKDPEKVFELYRIIQEDREKSKHIKITKRHVAGLVINETSWADDYYPADSK